MNGTYKAKEELLFDIQKLMIKKDREYRKLVKQVSDMIDNSEGMIDTTTYIALQSDIAKSISDLHTYKLAYAAISGATDRIE